MNWQAPVGSTCRTYNSGSRGAEGPEFIRCVDGQDSQIHEVWAFGSDDIMREFHPTARLYVGAEIVGELSSNFLTESWCRVPILGQI